MFSQWNNSFFATKFQPMMLGSVSSLNMLFVYVCVRRNSFYKICVGISRSCLWGFKLWIRLNTLNLFSIWTNKNRFTKIRYSVLRSLKIPVYVHCTQTGVFDYTLDLRSCWPFSYSFLLKCVWRANYRLSAQRWCFFFGDRYLYEFEISDFGNKY